jgi:hypothetical protein
MNQPLNKKKNAVLYKIGIGMISISFLLWLVPVIAPFLNITSALKATLIAGALIAAEIIFWIGVVFVGKEVAAKYRGYFNPRNWRKKQKDKD